MSTATIGEASTSPDDVDRWAVETHGLTKRFGDNVAVNGVEIVGSPGMCVWLPRPERGGQDDSHPGAARTDARRCRIR